MKLNKHIYHNMICAFDIEIFSNMYFLENNLQQSDFVKILILLNKYYPSYTYNKGSLNANKNCHQGMKWEEIVLNNYSLEGNTYIDLYFNIPIFIQTENQIEILYTTENGVGITLEKDERFGFVFILNIYPNVFLNKNYYSVFDLDKHKWNEVCIDQTLAAIENRKILTGFLKELEALLKVEISHYESLKFDKDYINKYGFNDNVALEGTIT
ncbi:hypothetical protein [Flavobacterium davisii]|uniref:Uncharacterized protein n=1 Tax=Flavobacterium columnare TaxID=996 RepID=A0A8G0KW22_9FLAO|nr:hypothetical protein [Flavobacterium davisii]QYS89469.1 hypothetical protein JJC05_04100 [Flavobacterium davisii]